MIEDTYWRISTTGEYYSVARQAFVSFDDATFVQWREHGILCAVDTFASLRATLASEDTPAPFEDECRAECARRILALASEATQRNLAGYMAMLGLKPSLTTGEQADVAAFGAAMGWIAAMREKWRELYDAGDMDWRDDTKWPACPAEAAALAARF